jgi:hypothetical protein
MDKGRVGEESKGKEKDRHPLTATNEMFSGRFGAVSRMASKRNQLQRRPKSFGRTRAEERRVVRE